MKERNPYWKNLIGAELTFTTGTVRRSSISKLSPDERSDIRVFGFFLFPVSRCAHAGYALLPFEGGGASQGPGGVTAPPGTYSLLPNFGGPPASSFSGSLRNPLQAPTGPPRNLPGEFNGQPFSGHAFDQLQNRGIPPSVVDQAVQNGIPNPGNTPGTTRFYDPTNNLSVVQDNATGNIITIRPGN
jgi:hypothetical protein